MNLNVSLENQEIKNNFLSQVWVNRFYLKLKLESRSYQLNKPEFKLYIYM